MSKNLTFGRSATLLALLVSASAVHADVKLVSKFTMTSEMAPEPKVQTLTGYYKAAMVRTESSDGKIVIMNGKTHKSYMIDPAKKTYSEFSAAGMSGVSADMAKKMNMKVTGHITPSPERKKILGKPAQKYIGDIVITAMIPGTEQQPSMGTMEAKMHFEQWTTTAVHISLTTDQMIGTMGQMLQGFGVGDNMKPLMKEASKIKGLPMGSTTKMVMTLHPSSSAGAPPAGTPMSFTMNMEMTPISIKEAPLSPDLFVVPKGYKKVAPQTAKINKAA